MARASTRLINALKRAADKIDRLEEYQWGHMGACNCGHLAQELTSYSKREIHGFALLGHGDWSEQVEAFCPTSSLPMDLLISDMLSTGLSLKDLAHLERLSDPEIRSRMTIGAGSKLQFNNNNDVARYMRAWAQMLEVDLSNSKKSIRKFPQVNPTQPLH